MPKSGKEEGEVSIDNVKDKILSYEHQIKDYLTKIDAKVDTYRFSVEKHGEAITIDISFRATIQPKEQS